MRLLSTLEDNSSRPCKQSTQLLALASIFHLLQLIDMRGLLTAVICNACEHTLQDEQVHVQWRDLAIQRDMTQRQYALTYEHLPFPCPPIRQRRRSSRGHDRACKVPFQSGLCPIGMGGFAPPSLTYISHNATQGHWAKHSECCYQVSEA